MNRFTGLLVAAALALLPAAQLSGNASGSPIPDPGSPIPDPRSPIPDPGSLDAAAITQVLNRLTFGARSADVERVQQMGLNAWIDQQLHPSKIDDHAAEALLPPLGTPPD